MSQPPPYTRQADFTGHSTDNPGQPQPGVSLDAEFNAIRATLVVVLGNLALLQRDDGRLRNGSVGIDALSAGILALVNSTSGMRARIWATATAYEAGLDWIANGTATYFCAASHISDDFADDLAAGRWVLIYDSAGAIPADGSVTTPKLANGAVTADKVGFTGLDLVDTLRAQGGLRAGTATSGLISGKAAEGDALSSIERTTRAQGRVGFVLGGGSGGIAWTLSQPAASDATELHDGTAVRVRWTGALTDHIGRVMASGSNAPAAGAGISLAWSSSQGWLDSYDYTASQWRGLNMRGGQIGLFSFGVQVMSATAAGVHFPVEATIGAGAARVGYRGVPQNPRNGAYELQLADSGGHVYSKNSGAQTITVPANAATAFPIETTISIVNRGSSPITIAAAAGVTMRMAGPGSTGNRTLAVNGIATLIKVETNEWMIVGPGLS